MKKIFILILLACSMACTQERTHSEILSEIAASNRQYQEKRKAFQNSEQYRQASQYLDDFLSKSFKDDYQYSIEPKNFDKEPSYDLATFYHESDVSISAHYQDVYDRPEDFANALIEAGISCMFTTEVSDQFYLVDGIEKTYEIYVRPGV